MKARSIRTLVVLLVLMLASAACSDDGSNGGGAGSSPSARATEQPTGSSPDSPGALADADCREYADSFAGVSPDPNNPASFANLGQIAGSMEKIADKVPNEISDDFRVLAAAYREFAEGLGTLDFSDPSSFANVTPEELEKMEQSLKSLDREEVRAAAANIEQFVKVNCPQG